MVISLLCWGLVKQVFYWSKCWCIMPLMVYAPTPLTRIYECKSLSSVFKKNLLSVFTKVCRVHWVLQFPLQSKNWAPPYKGKNTVSTLTSVIIFHILPKKISTVAYNTITPLKWLPCHYSLSIWTNIKKNFSYFWLKTHIQHPISFI